MGESQPTLLQPRFNRSIRVEARPERLGGDAGALLLRELADRLAYRAVLVDALADARDPLRLRHPFGELLLTDLLLRAQGSGAAHAIVPCETVASYNLMEKEKKA